jgi:hypothetical protein
VEGVRTEGWDIGELIELNASSPRGVYRFVVWGQHQQIEFRTVNGKQYKAVEGDVKHGGVMTCRKDCKQ